MKKNTILIVDDNPGSLKILVSFLKQCQLKIYVAKSGEETLQRLQQTYPDLILLDIKMSGMDGFQTCEKIKKKPATSEIPIIFMTALTETHDKVKGFTIGGVDYITKPFQHEEVLARVNTHLKLQQANKELQSLNAAKDKLFSIIAHDLKNPFSGLIGTLQFLLKSLDDLESSEVRDCLEAMHTTSTNASDLLHNLLLWAKSQTKTIKWNPTQIKVKDLVDRNISLLKEQIHTKNLKCILNIDNEISVLADYNMMDTILRNLLTNSVKYTKNGGEITVECCEQEDFIQISVRDSGVGIEKEQIEQIFEIRGIKSTLGTNGESGTGLGLILCKEFILRHGGEIKCESCKEKGSVFYFTLPKVTQ